MDEQELVRKVQGGDEDAFAEIVRLYKDRIVNYLSHFTGDYQKAVDLSQETFIRVYFKAAKYKPIAPFSSWVYAIASNLARTELKRDRRRATVPLEEMASPFESGAFCEDKPDSGLVRNLRLALDGLHPRYRVPVLLKDVEGFSQEEIARIIRKPVGTVKARISRGRAYLKRELDKAVIDPSGGVAVKGESHGRA
ncbi:MAG: RNA polymerase sigma factor [Candidatus Aminicenantes bacterium]|nr:RNA polymerase sigma factor [Candidatus Aminicenantes bacterium]